MTDIISRTLTHPPVDTRYIAGLWHPARVSPRGIWTELRVLGASLIKPANRDVHKFLIIGRARSGSTLLTRLLNDHPQVHCGREILSRRVLFPQRFLNRLAQKTPQAAYGAKLLSYQMIQVQRFRDPVGFLQGLADSGFRFIHLERDTFAQTFSLDIAQTRRIYHQRDETAAGQRNPGWEHGAKIAQATAPVQLDLDDFIARLKWSALLLEYERHCLRGFDHMTVSYEADLQEQSAHQPLTDRVFDWIGVPPAPTPVAGGMKKILPADPREMITNYEALADRLHREGLSDLLPAPPS
ncbi:sulfotransferase [uncultured Roseobacter sp.]|uniref:sulfotransferase n=1 Tax=uncultured Roseobacter sp. TaxID=114847 RepID=UPI00262ACBF7|nr:sulfotransferase [uncultured Roseobacter sp.]